MPELPETETIARDLDAHVRGATIVAVKVPRTDVLREVDATQLALALVGRRIARVWRRAKLVVLDVDGADSGDQAIRRHIVVQPRFTGGVLLDDGVTTPRKRSRTRPCRSFWMTGGGFTIATSGGWER